MNDDVHRIELLRMAHGDLNDSIAALAAAAVRDEIQLARLKKRKLRLKDEIAILEARAIPDLSA